MFTVTMSGAVDGLAQKMGQWAIGKDADDPHMAPYRNDASSHNELENSTFHPSPKEVFHMEDRSGGFKMRSQNLFSSEFVR
jgi:hypothetical protein